MKTSSSIFWVLIQFEISRNKLNFEVTNVRSVHLPGGVVDGVAAGDAVVFEIKGLAAIERVNALLQKRPALQQAAHVSKDQQAAARFVSLAPQKCL